MLFSSFMVFVVISGKQCQLGNFVKIIRNEIGNQLLCFINVK